MRIIPLSEIEAMENGEAIPAIQGKVKIVFVRKQGTSEHGDWSFQDFVLTDGSAEVIVKASNLDDLSDLKGQDITIESNKSEKHGLTGVKKLIEEYRGKVQHKVKLTSSCKIKTNHTKQGETSEESSPDPDCPEAERGDEPLTRPQQQAIREQQISDNGVVEARRHLMRSSNLYCLCTDAVQKVIWPHLIKTDNPFATPDLFQAAVSTLFIESSRSNMVSKMPDKPL